MPENHAGGEGMLALTMGAHSRQYLAINVVCDAH
jgi:hypothetical protein